MNCILTIFVFYFTTVHSTRLPRDFHTCHRSDPNFNECVRSSTEDAVGKLVHGNKELSIIPLEPVRIGMISVKHTPGSSVQLDQTFKNLKLHGLSKTKVLNVSIDFEKCNVHAVSLTPSLRMEADFILKGRLLLFSINGEGPSNVTLSNLIAIHNITCEHFTKKNSLRFRVTDYKIALKPEKIVYKFENLIKGGSEILNEQIHNVINGDPLSVFEEVRSAHEHTYGIIFKEIANKIFTKIPLKDIFPE